jgi:hypothetical protein
VDSGRKYEHRPAPHTASSTRKFYYGTQYIQISI